MPSLPSDFRLGRFLLDAGDFRARARHTYAKLSDPSDLYGPYIAVDFRIKSHPTNLDHLQIIRDQLGLGYLWNTGHSAGWCVNRVPDARALFEKLGGGAGHPRWDVVERWGYCISLMPMFLRPKLEAKNQVYKAAEHAETRMAAIADLATARRKHPPIYKELPPDFFLLWA